MEPIAPGSIFGKNYVAKYIDKNFIAKYIDNKYFAKPKGATMEPLTISTGKVADGKGKYFDRPGIEKKIWTTLDRKEHLLLAAPRRTGKSSILKNIERNPKDNYLVKYKSVQSIDSVNEYFKQLCKILLEDNSIFGFYERHFKITKGAVKNFISRIRGLSTEGITIDPEEHVDYYLELVHLLKTLPDTFNTILLLIDEFPDAVRNIATLDTNEAVRFLQLNRNLRQELNHVKLQFVYTGSIGLGNVVSRLNRLDLINDIVNIEVPPLGAGEAKEFIARLILGLKKEDSHFDLSDDAVDHILNKDSWLIPYYIQIIMSELFDSFKAGRPILPVAIDETIGKIIRDRYRYQDYFENWKTRLKQAFEKDEYTCARVILDHISVNGTIDHDTLYNLIVKHGVDDPKTITNVLEYDGYIYRNTKREYRFNSIILKEWWCLNVAI